MKKLVCFTLAMVLALAGAAIASDEVNGNLSNNIVPVAAGDNSVAVSANDNKLFSPDVEVKDNYLRYKSANVETDDILSNNKVAVAWDDAQQAGQVAAKNKAQVAINGGINAKDRAKVGENFDNNYVVDNAILANVNVAADIGLQAPIYTSDSRGRHDDPKKDDCCPAVSQTNTFNKTQCGEIGGSFNGATGVSNANAAGGNMNKQTAYTTIGVAFVK